MWQLLQLLGLLCLAVACHQCCVVKLSQHRPPFLLVVYLGCMLAAGWQRQAPAGGPGASAEKAASVGGWPAGPGTSSGPSECVM
jgi:hypothetical protein